MAKKSVFSLMIAFTLVLSTLSHAAVLVPVALAFDASIDKITVNDATVIESRTNLVTDINPTLGPDNFAIGTEITALTFLDNSRIEVILKGKDSGLSVSDSTGALDIFPGSLFAFFSLQLTDGMRDETEFELTVRVADALGKKEEKKYNLATRERRSLASGFDISIDRVTANGQALSSGRNNFVPETTLFSMRVDITALSDAENVHIEGALRDLRTGNTVADSTATFDITDDNSYTNFLTMNLIDPLDESGAFELNIQVIDEEGRVVSENYGIRMDDDSRSEFDASINTVRVNNEIVAQSSNNRVDEQDTFNVLVDITALEDLESARIEVAMRDRNSGLTVADATANFNLNEDASLSALLQLDLIDEMKRSGAFELTARVVDAEGNRVQKTYGISMDGNIGTENRELDLSIDRVEVEDDKVLEGQTNFVLIGQNTNELDLEVAITSLQDIEKAKVEAILTYENGDVVSDATANFDINDEQTTTKRLELPLLAKFEQGVFRLTVKISDSEGDFVERIYTLRLSQDSFPIIIDSIEATQKVAAGKSVVAKINMQNTGLVSLKGMILTASIPELGISEERFLTKNSQEFSEEFVFAIPRNAEPGKYTLRAEATTQFGGDKETRQATFNVVERGAEPLPDMLVITVPITEQDVEGDKESVYPLIFQNNGPSSTYTLSVDGRGWADIRLDDSNVFILKTGETRTINAYVRSNGEEEGMQSFTVTVSSKGNVLKQLSLNGNLKESGALIGVKALLMYTLIAIVVILAILGALFAAGKITQSEPEESGSTEYNPEPYY